MSDVPADSSSGQKIGGEPPLLDPETKRLVERIEELPTDKIVRELVVGFASRSHMGPDPETASILAETERFAENAKLEAYKENLRNRDKQNERDHDFRLQRLKTQTLNTRLILVAALVLVGIGVWLLIGGKSQQLGSNLVIAGGGLLYAVLSGKNPFEKD